MPIALESTMARTRAAHAVGIAGVLVARAASAQQHEQPAAQLSESGLSREVENPISKLRQVPVQYLTELGVGPAHLARTTIAIQPLLPFSVSDDISIVSRTRVPFMSSPDLTSTGGAYVTGLGDVTESLFLVPRPSAGIIWGIGPTALLPTATASDLGAGRFAVGVSAAVVTRPEPFTFGVLAGPIWSIAGSSNRPDIRQLAIMGLAALHLPRGWYVNTAPVVTVNWNAFPSGDMWTVPVGAGAGKVFHIGDVPMDVSTSAYWHVIRPDTASAPAGTVQVEVAVLLP
jgi:hypothetical protein